jgi:L-lactate dehydrogenase complex protein LldE
LKIGLFIPCYIDQFYPHVGVSVLKLLERFDLDIEYPLSQTCCGQPMANAGYEKYSNTAGKLFVKNFASYDYIVSPSGSCVMHVKEHLGLNGTDIPHRTFELCEFLTDIINVKKLDASFPFRVGLHASCHGLRGLRLGKASELNLPDYNKPRSLLEMVKGIQLINLSRMDECCGFGGTFSITEEAVSVRMGEDRIEDHLSHGAEVITSADMSCLMHLEGLIRRQGKNVKVMHIAEILGRNE